VAEKWRRCEKCRKVKPVDDFGGDSAQCAQCQAPVVRRATGRSAARVTTSRLTAVPDGPAVVRTATPMRDLRGRGDTEVRARRARVRALDRLAEQHAEDFDQLLAEERRAEGL
jgi:hypothetical protein